MRVLGLGWLALALMGCLEAVTEGRDSGAPARVGTTGPDGGSVFGPDASAWFQPGALVDSVSPTLVPYQVTAPAGYRPAGPGWLASPEGLRFERAVTLTLPLEASSILPGDPIYLFTAPLNGSGFELLEGTRVGDTLVTFIWHFSVLLPVTPIRVDAGAPDAGRAIDGGTRDAGAGSLPPFDGGCQPILEPAISCGAPISDTDGGSCRLTSHCDGGDRVVECEFGRCECRVAGVVRTAVTGFPNSCFGAWNCLCGFPSLCPARGSEPTPGAQPGVGDYPIGTRCIDRWDCRESLCWNSDSRVCASNCDPTAPGPTCPCGKTCEVYGGHTGVCTPN